MARETAESTSANRQIERIVMLFYMKKISKFLDVTLWILVVLGIAGGGISAYVISSFLAGGNGTEATVQPVRPVLDDSDRSRDRLSLDGQRPIETDNARERLR